MRSFKSRLYQWGLHVFGQMTVGTEKKMMKYINKEKSFLPLKKLYQLFDIEQIEVNQLPCFIVKPKNANPKNKKFMYLHGGGYIRQITSFHWKFIMRIINETGQTCYVPIYRCCRPNVAPLHENLAFATACYQLMLKTTKASDITIMGDSAGAHFSIVMGLHCKKIKLPQPGHIVAISPVASFLASRDDCLKMADSDPVLPFQLLLRCMEWYAKNEDPKAYYLSPLFANLSGLPKTMITMGENEAARPQVTELVKKMKKANLKVDYIIAKDMFHVYPLFQFREGIQDRLKICKFIK